MTAPLDAVTFTLDGEVTLDDFAKAMAKRRRSPKKRKPKDSRVVIAGEPFKAIAGLFGKAGSSRRSSRAKPKRS